MRMQRTLQAEMRKREVIESRQHGKFPMDGGVIIPDVNSLSPPSEDKGHRRDRRTRRARRVLVS
jgi:hypothetical protein